MYLHMKKDYHTSSINKHTKRSEKKKKKKDKNALV